MQVKVASASPHGSLGAGGRAAAQSRALPPGQNPKLPQSGGHFFSLGSPITGCRSCSGWGPITLTDGAVNSQFRMDTPRLPSNPISKSQWFPKCGLCDPASAPPGTLLEMRIARPYPTPADAETWGGGTQKSVLTSPPGGFWCPLKLESYCSK